MVIDPSPTPQVVKALEQYYSFTNMPQLGITHGSCDVGNISVLGIETNLAEEEVCHSEGRLFKRAGLLLFQ